MTNHVHYPMGPYHGCAMFRDHQRAQFHLFIGEQREQWNLSFNFIGKFRIFSQKIKNIIFTYLYVSDLSTTNCTERVDTYLS